MAETKRGQYQRVSPIKPSLRGAGNWTRAQFRAASYSRKAFWRLALSIFIIFSVMTYLALWMGGVLPAVKNNMSAFKQNRLMSIGFIVKDIDVVGEGRIREHDVRTALGVYEGQYFFGPDLEAAQNRIERLNWVENVVVRRLWPNKIVVEIIERDVFALWQHNGQMHVIDHSGAVITDVSYQDYVNLPHFIGGNVDESAADFLKTLSQHADLSSRFTTIRRVGDRRWDMIDVKAGLTVKLPESGVNMALSRLVYYHKQTGWLDRKIDMIDMRLDDRMSISPASGSQS